MVTETEAEDAVRTWLGAGTVLEQVRRRELRELTAEDALVAVLDLLDLAAILPPKVGGSGLVEQQRYFATASR